MKKTKCVFSCVYSSNMHDVLDTSDNLSIPHIHTCTKCVVRTFVIALPVRIMTEWSIAYNIHVENSCIRTDIDIRPSVPAVTPPLSPPLGLCVRSICGDLVSPMYEVRIHALFITKDFHIYKDMRLIKIDVYALVLASCHCFINVC